MTETYPIVTSATAAKYTYYAVDIVTNKILAQIPFEDVVYEKTLKGAGSFDGKISINKQTKDLDLYNSTLPGKCALYVVRNGVCMWGGIIWGRTYDLFGRSLNITASEFTSYLKHRIIWKTYSYQFTAKLTKTSKKSDGVVTLSDTNNVNLKIPIKVLDDYGNLNHVYVSFTRSDLIQYNNYYPLSTSTTPTTRVFSVSIPDLPEGSYTDVSISIRVDTYEYLKELMKEAAQDFVDTQFANDIIAPGIKIPYQITNKVASAGVVTLTTSGSHSLVPGQNIEIRNVDDNVDGYRVVSEVPSSTSFRVVVPTYNVTSVSFSGTTATVVVDTSSTSDVFKLSVNSLVTISGVPSFGGYDYFNGTNLKILSVSNNNTFTYETTNPWPTVATITNITSTASEITYYTTANLPAGRYVTVKNANISAYNVDKRQITYTDSTMFKVANPTGKVISGTYVSGSTTTLGYIGVPVSSGSPGTVSQISISSTNIDTKKYEVATRAFVTGVPFGVVSASRTKNSDNTKFIVTLKLSTINRTFPFQKGDTVSTVLPSDKDGKFTSLTNGDGGGTPLSAVDKVAKTISYELEGISVKNDNGTLIADTLDYKLGIATNTVNYAINNTEIELGLVESTPLIANSYIYVAGVDGPSWNQPVYNGFHKIKSSSVTSAIETSITAYSTIGGVATLYTATNNVFDSGQKVKVTGFTGGLTSLNSGSPNPVIQNSIQGDKDGESYFTYFIDDNTYRAKTYTTGTLPVASVAGQNKFRYDLPEYSPIGEPDGTYTAVKYRLVGYPATATAGNKKSTLTIKTQEKVSLSSGDYINLFISNTDVDGSYKVDTVSSDGYFIYCTLTESKSKVKADGDTTFKDCTGSVIRFKSQLDQQSLKYAPTVSGLSCESNVVKVRSDKHKFSAGDSVSLIFPAAFQDYDNNGYKATIQFVEDDYFTYTVNNFRSGITSAPTAGVSQISKYKFTKSSTNTTSGTVRFTTVAENYYTVGSKVTVTNIAKKTTGSAFQKNFVWSTVYTISAVSGPGATVKWFEAQVTGLTSAANITETTLTSPNYGKSVSTAMLIENSSALTSGSATTTKITYLGTSLPFSAGQKITVVGFTGTGSTTLNSVSNEILVSPTNSTTLTVNYSGSAVSSISTGAPFAYVRRYPTAVLDYSESTSAQAVYGISAVSSTKIVTVYCPNHGFYDQDLVKLVLLPSATYANYTPTNSKPAVITKIDDNTFSYAVTSTISDISASGPITNISVPTTGTVRFYATNSFSVEDKLVIRGVLPDVYNIYYVTVTGATSSYFEIASTETSSYISSTGIAMKALIPTGTAINAPYVSITPVVFSRSYGEFPSNTDIGGLDFDGTTYSGNFYPNTIVRGSDMVTLDAHMDQYSNSVNGFNYRIDCTLEVDSVTGISTFRRKFVLIPITPVTLKEYLNTLPGGVLPTGEVAPPYAFGADKITFEHPGNVENVNFSESAENSATRMFVSGNNGAGDPNSTARFSGAADNDLLESGWPILDRAEKIDWPTQYNPLAITVNRDNWGNYDSEADFYTTAQRFLYQSRPPQGDFIIRVNGSLPPVIGTYKPGDWCQLIVEDEAGFINSRLASVLEPRKDVILRRIDNIKVSVPNSPAFPEEIDLTLVTDWEVDKIGK